MGATELSGFDRKMLLFIFLMMLGACSTLQPDEPVEAPKKELVAQKPAKPINRQQKSDAIKMPAQKMQAEAQLQIELDSSRWEMVENTDGITSYREKLDRDGLVAFRGEGVIPASIEKVLTVFNNDELRKEWVDALLEAKTVRYHSPTSRVDYNLTKVPWPFQNRDFVYAVNVQVKKKQRAVLIELKSIEDELMPSRDGFVRGEIVYSYYWIQEVVSHQSTRVVVEMMVDPKGNIPKWLVTASQKKWPYKTLSSLSRISQRDEIKVSKELENYLQ